MKCHCCLQQFIFSSSTKRIQPVGVTTADENHYTLNTSSAVCLMMKDRGSEVLYTLYQPVKSDVWADLSATLTGDQNQRALFRVASPLRGKLEHSQGCRKLFRKTDLVPEQATHLPMEMSIRITASLAPPGFHDHFQNMRIRSFSHSPWSGPLKSGHMSVRLRNADKNAHYNDAHPALFSASNLMSASPRIQHRVSQNLLTRWQNMGPPVSSLSEAP
jgi:hypothetical protein